jgi:hypothetical protein
VLHITGIRVDASDAVDQDRDVQPGREGVEH